MGQSPSVPVEHARLIFTRNSLSNNNIQCDALGIHYQLSTPKEIKTTRTTVVSRWDPHQQKDVPVAEWEKRIIGSDRIRFIYNRPVIEDDTESEDGLVPIGSFFPRTGGIPRSSYFRRSFTFNGVTYTWRSRAYSLVLYRGEKDVAVATFARRQYLVNRRRPYIALGPGCEDILDQLLVTCLYAEQKRREAKEGPVRRNFEDVISQ
ncbi:uncharacterized protein FOMMEDRAFT_170634 [Fomitiporia mediterranea MF3/22]|uniref:uncharacterized protein n=1 Tax=Fomitiporia mediterranea (strain MF3/22) TaxID=694068 RepID=UPI0004407CEC|nr:uncharacterized protein FOMMEDRAFT_170634 [Fomitiporia mediterranea MF3/22]EJC99347.1 hypothetical protein FOMMEDRAFT_170634 [Fomitiporia mediterranea MF3/22]